MSEEKFYTVYTSTTRFESGYGFKAVEVLPPLPKSLAEVVRMAIVGYFDEITPGYAAVVAHGFCDEGATVSTLLQFTSTLGFEPSVADEHNLKLQNLVKKTISPSGGAV